MQCPVCGAQNETTAAFCFQCGSALRPPNPATGQTVSLDRAPWTAPQAQPTEPTYGNVTPPSAAPVAERPSRVYDVPTQSSPMVETLPSAAPFPSSTAPYVVGTAPIPTSQTSTTAILSLVFGILSWTFLPLIGGVVAIITGHMARRELRSGNTNMSGAGFALAGLILGYLNLFVSIAGCAFLVLGLGLATGF